MTTEGPDRPNFEAMTDDERAAWLKAQRRPMPRGARPILVGVVLSFVWFIVLSPLIAAPFGPQLSPTVIDRGRADVISCSRSWTTLWRMYACEATVAWERQELARTTVSSSHELSGQVAVVARNRLTNGRASNVTTFGKRTVVVPADMPANTGASVALLTVLNVAAMVVVWGTVIAVVTRGGAGASRRRQPPSTLAGR
ncbi:hypothetical protein ACSDQ9_12405 [Aestuariimicrobium soli]|uniref:hypothetical protein n=1 Tax=Aestuariimicrobium soli TaxID=2035834 RepID=UPI003EBDF193